MFSDDVCSKLQNIIHGNVIQEQPDTCTAIRNQLSTSYPTSTTVKTDFESKQLIKKEQVSFLQELARSQNLFIPSIPAGWNYLTHGGEASVYLHPDQLSVVKLNDAIYYATWLEYFNSVVIHNLLFPDTAYTFLGFTQKEDSLLAVLKQPFVSSDETADLNAIREYLAFNGFEHKVRQDYFNKEFGLILEDMHDENVILKNGSLFFIDTVFYMVK
ncbi:MAG TPA: hypothetical protein VF476_19670 [Chitinophagaceae bacterium]